MLRGIRTASANWLGKLVMAIAVGALIVSFAIWGIGDIFRGSARTTVAQIGNTEISAEQFRQIYNDRMQQIGRQIGRPLRPEQARALGLDQQLLAQLLAEAALDQRARVLRLGIADSEVARRIVQEPAFRGISGQFDQARFEQLIRQAGYTEQRYVAEQRRLSLRQQIAASISGGVKVPRAALEAVNRFENEERSLDYLVLRRAAAGDIPAPTAEVLAKYFEDRKALFRAPEYRKLVLLVVSPDEIARTIEISDADAKRVYEERQARFSSPERREVQQIVLANEEDARTAAKRLAAGATFESVAAERGLKASDYELGLMAKTDILDRAVADAAFALAPGAVSEPITGRFGVVLVRVKKVEPARVRPFAEVEGEIKHEIAIERAKSEVASRRDKIEDELAGGARLDESARKLQMPFRAIEAADRSGRGEMGNPIPDLPQGADVISAAFAASAGAENEPLQLPGGGYVWYEVAGITPSRERALAEVKDRVEARWRDEEVATRLKAKADDMVDRLKAAGTLAELAAANGLTVDSAAGVKRRGTDALPSPVVAALFRTPKDAPATAEGKEATERFVFRVTAVSVPTLDAASAEAQRLNDSLRRAYADELMSEYVANLEADLGVRINQSALRQAIGAGGG